MFHMLSCFNLANGISIDEFQKSNTVFLEHMRELQLVQSNGPIGRRKRHPIMDTDKERDQEYFYIMTFLDEQQCDLAVKYIQSHELSGHSVHNSDHISIHRDVSSKIGDSVFICWEDI